MVGAAVGGVALGTGGGEAGGRVVCRWCRWQVAVAGRQVAVAVQTAVVWRCRRAVAVAVQVAVAVVVVAVVVVEQVAGRCSAFPVVVAGGGRWWQVVQGRQVQACTGT